MINFKNVSTENNKTLKNFQFSFPTLEKPSVNLQPLLPILEMLLETFRLLFVIFRIPLESFQPPFVILRKPPVSLQALFGNFRMSLSGLKQAFVIFRMPPVIFQSLFATLRMPPVRFQGVFVKLRIDFCLFWNFFDLSFVRDGSTVEDVEPVTP